MDDKIYRCQDCSRIFDFDVDKCPACGADNWDIFELVSDEDEICEYCEEYLDECECDEEEDYEHEVEV